ncbi:uncharacterized protein LOC109407778 isoform X1 [Aedes albopictus]|uniref:RING-CH-type domain-containing protein n=1 Tax=Aedes albopictus TaxID=7160 RepID=A0ABM1Z541_AEDAL|nr:uncharacterized protein LOC109407778 [Aedes albopictus]
MTNQQESGLLSGIQAVRLFWSVHDQRRRSSQLTQLARSQNPSSEENRSDEDPSHASDDDNFNELRFCRICRLSDDHLLENVCGCKGTMGQIHERCLRLWTIYKRSQMCEICQCKFRWNFDRKLLVKLSNWTIVWNFFRRKYFWVLLRDFLNFMVLFGISAIQNAKILTMVQDDTPNLVLPLALIGASMYDLYFSRWVMGRTLRAYNLVREYWILAHDDEFLGYFNEEYAVFGENQSEIENMLLAEYDAPD